MLFFTVDIENFLAGNQPQSQNNSQETETDSLGGDADDTNPLFSNNSSEDSCDMLYMSDEGGEGEGCNVPLLQTITGSCSTTQRSSNHSLPCNLQYWLFYYCKPVAFCRFALLILYVVLLGGSLYLDTKIQPSEKPPAFFSRESNLQQLLDLQYNMSNNDYECKICDDIVDMASNFIHGLPKTTTAPITKHLTTVKVTKKPTRASTTTKFPYDFLKTTLKATTIATTK